MGDKAGTRGFDIDCLVRLGCVSNHELSFSQVGGVLLDHRDGLEKVIRVPE